jgi:hypothetical protein
LRVAHIQVNVIGVISFCLVFFGITEVELKGLVLVRQEFYHLATLPALFLLADVDRVSLYA